MIPTGNLTCIFLIKAYVTEVHRWRKDINKADISKALNIIASTEPAPMSLNYVNFGYIRSLFAPK